MTIGKLHSKDSLFLRLHVGEAKDGKVAFELSNGMGGTMMVRSEQTGRFFSVSWQEVIDLAIAAGIETVEKSETVKRKKKSG